MDTDSRVQSSTWTALPSNILTEVEETNVTDKEAEGRTANLKRDASSTVYRPNSSSSRYNTVYNDKDQFGLGIDEWDNPFYGTNDDDRIETMDEEDGYEEEDIDDIETEERVAERWGPTIMQRIDELLNDMVNTNSSSSNEDLTVNTSASNPLSFSNDIPSPVPYPRTVTNTQKWIAEAIDNRNRLDHLLSRIGSNVLSGTNVESFTHSSPTKKSDPDSTAKEDIHDDDQRSIVSSVSHSTNHSTTSTSSLSFISRTSVIPRGYLPCIRTTLADEGNDTKNESLLTTLSKTINNTHTIEQYTNILKSEIFPSVDPKDKETTASSSSIPQPRYGRSIPFALIQHDPLFASSSSTSTNSNISPLSSSSISSSSSFVHTLTGSFDTLDLPSHNDLKSSLTNETFILNDTTTLFSPSLSRLTLTLAELILNEDSTIQPSSSHSTAETLIATASRIRANKIGNEIAVKFLSNPQLMNIQSDTIFTPPVQIHIKSSYHGGIYGLGATTEVPIVYHLRPLVRTTAGTSSTGPSIGRLCMHITQEIVFDSILDDASIHSSSNIAQSSDPNESVALHTKLRLRVSAGRVDVRFFPGDETVSARSMLASMKPRLLNLMLAAPLPDDAVIAINAAAEDLARQAKNKEIAKRLQRQRRRRGSFDILKNEVSDHSNPLNTVNHPQQAVPIAEGIYNDPPNTGIDTAADNLNSLNNSSVLPTPSSSVLPGDSKQILYPSLYGSGTARPSLLGNDEEEIILVETLDEIGGQHFAYNKWKILTTVKDGDEEEDEEEDGKTDGTKEQPTKGSNASPKSSSAPSVLNESSAVRLATGMNTNSALAMIPSAYTQAYAWGRGEYGVLGIGTSNIDSPIPIPVPFAGEVGTWRVKSVACGWYHTVILTDVGIIYTWGSGSDGQLGHGDTFSCTTPRMVEFFGLRHPLVVTSVSAGSDPAGSHTVVVAMGHFATSNRNKNENGPTVRKDPFLIPDGEDSGSSEDDEEETKINEDDDAETIRSKPIGIIGHRGGKDVAMLGRVFAWGYGSAVGNGSMTNLNSPKLVRSGLSDMYALHHGGVVSVAGGGGFALALTRSGAVYSWGKYANGRLGLGMPPESRHKGFGGTKRYVRYSLTPLRISKGWTMINNSKMEEPVSTDQPVETTKTEKNPVIISNDPTTILSKDSVSPPVPVIEPVLNAYGSSTRPIRSIAAGEAHALAIDAYGLLWSWGRGANGQTGLGFTADVLAPRQVYVWRSVPASSSDTSQPSTSTRRNSIDPHHDHSSVVSSRSSVSLLSSGNSSASSSLVTSSSIAVRFTTIACGCNHSLAIAIDGSLYTWGANGNSCLGHGDARLKEGMKGTPASIINRVRARQQNELYKHQRNARRIARREAEAEGKPLPPITLSTSFATPDGEEEEDDKMNTKKVPSKDTKDETDRLAKPLHKRLGWKRPWLVPRPVRVFDGTLPSMQVMATGGGANHSWALTRYGRLFIWGENTSGVLGMGITDPKYDEPLPRLVGVTYTNGLRTPDPSTSLLTLGAHVRVAADNVFVCGSGGWHMVAIATGSILGENLRASWSLNSFTALRNELNLPKPGSSSSPVHNTNASLASSSSSISSRTNTYIVKQNIAYFSGNGTTSAHRLPKTDTTINRGNFVPNATLPFIKVSGYDVTLILDNHRKAIPAHRCILAARSPLFAKRLMSETRPGRRGRLFVSDMTFDIASQILEFLYTDDLSVPLSPLSPNLRTLANTANMYGITRLELICRIMLDAPINYWVRQLRSAEEKARLLVQEELVSSSKRITDDDLKNEIIKKLAEIETDQLVAPPVAREQQIKASITLSDLALSLPYHLLQNGLLNPYWADVVFISEGWRFSAHAVILCSTCEYFRVLLHDSMNERYHTSSNDDYGINDGLSVDTGTRSSVDTGTLNTNGRIEIELPDSAMTTVRLLYYAYTGWLAPLPRDSDEANTYGLIPGVKLPFEREPSFDIDENGDAKEAEATAKIPLVARTWTPNQQLLLDLVAADRYGLDGMRALVESTMDITPSIAARVLELTHLVASPRLKESAMVTMLNALPVVTRTEGFSKMQERSPWLVNEVIERVMDRSDAYYGVLAEDMPPETLNSAAAASVLDTVSTILKDSKFPWIPLVAVVILFFVFLSVAEYNTSYTPYIPIVNMIILVILGFLAYRGILTT